MFNTLADFRFVMQRTSDVVILTDIAFPDNSLGGIEVIKEIQQEGKFLFLSFLSLRTMNL